MIKIFNFCLIYCSTGFGPLSFPVIFEIHNKKENIPYNCDICKIIKALSIPINIFSKTNLFSSDSEPEKGLGTEWLAQIEMDTHDGPARRLWMGPQFKFTQVQSDSNPFQCATSRVPSALLDSQEDLEGRRIQQSAPMPILRRRDFVSEQFSIPGSSGPTIEVGSGTFDRVGQQVDFGNSFIGEEKVRQTLFDAMNDETEHNNRRLCMFFQWL